MASTNLKFIVLVADSLQAMKDKKTLVHEEKFQDFSDFSIQNEKNEMVLEDVR